MREFESHVDLVKGEQLHETIAALQYLEDWRNDMHEEIDAINQIHHTATAGSWEDGDAGGEDIALRTWIRSVPSSLIGRGWCCFASRYCNE